MSNTRLNRIRYIAILAVAALSACGPQSFTPGNVTSRQSAAGNAKIPPKVDIVMGISMNGTMKNIYPGVQTEIPSFVQGLENSGWDYRFVTIPLSEYMPGSTYPVNQRVSASHYHNNYPENQWISPFPGAQYADAAFRLHPSLFSQVFNFPGEIDPQHNDGHETGFRNQVDFLYRNDVRTNFLRSDALLALITVSNGEDRSYGSWVPSWNGYQWQPGTGSNVATIANNLINLKSGSGLVKYYSLVAHNTTSCRGYGTWSGQRYEQMAQALGGTSVDICSYELSSALQQVSAHLQSQKLNFRRQYLVIGTEPNPATIKVTKYAGGNAGAAQVLPNSATNGWTYIGYRTNTNTIDSPIPMDARTGYFIELHGSAKLVGDDSADVNYTNTGSGHSF